MIDTCGALRLRRAGDWRVHRHFLSLELSLSRFFCAHIFSQLLGEIYKVELGRKLRERVSGFLSQFPHAYSNRVSSRGKQKIFSLV